jgi:hypothetical protein
MVFAAACSGGVITVLRPGVWSLHRLYSRQCAVPANGKQICDKDDRETFSSVQIPSLQDSSEFGPRALGNRSLLADPRKSEMKDILNKRVKHRQAFRPFAPIGLAERAKEVFEGEEDSPFMLIAKNVRLE